MREFIRPVATLLTGTVVAQALVYGSRPLLTRLYTPDDYGVLAFYAGFVAVVTSVSGGKYEDALMLPRDHGQAWSLAMASVILSLCTAAAVALLVPFRYALLPFVSSRHAADIIVLAPLSIIFVGVARTSDAWLTRLERFDVVARGRVTHSVSVVPGQIAGGVVKAGANGLVGGLLFGQAAQAAYYGWKARATASNSTVAKPTRSSIRGAARRYRRFAFFGAPGAALNTASVQLPALVLLFFFDASVLGNYGIGYSVLAVPMTLLGSAVSQVYYVRAAEAVRQHRLAELTEGVFRRLVAFGVFPILCVTIAGPEAFRFVFGASWSNAGLYAAYLAPWVFLVFVSSPLSRLFDLLEKQKELLMFNTALLAVRAVALLAGGYANNADLAILLFGTAGAFMWLLHTIWMLTLAGVRIPGAISTVGRYLGYSAVPAAVVVGLKTTGSDAWSTLGIVLGAAIYYYFVLRSDPDISVRSLTRTNGSSR